MNMNRTEVEIKCQVLLGSYAV